MEEEQFKTASCNELVQRFMELSSNLGVGLILYPSGTLNLSTSGKILFNSLDSLCHTQKMEIIAGTVESYENSAIRVADF